MSDELHIVLTDDLRAPRPLSVRSVRDARKAHRSRQASGASEMVAWSSWRCAIRRSQPEIAAEIYKALEKAGCGPELLGTVGSYVTH
jgi:Fe-S oxidoreductase